MSPITSIPEPEQAAIWPVVGVVMPILNEERHLEEAVTAVLAQDYPGEIELVLALGPSHDRTDEIATLIAVREPRVRIVANPTGRTPDALNAALAASRSDIVVRVDGHGVLDRDYVRTAYELLQEHRRRERGRADGRRGCHTIRASGRGRDDLPVGRWLLPFPHRRCAGRHRHGISWGVPPRVARSARRL